MTSAPSHLGWCAILMSCQKSSICVLFCIDCGDHKREGGAALFAVLNTVMVVKCNVHVCVCVSVALCVEFGNLESSC